MAEPETLPLRDPGPEACEQSRAPERRTAAPRAPEPCASEPCALARCLTVIGERWTLLILRDLMQGGPRRFQDFEQSLAGISPSTLSARLKRLQAHGLLTRRRYASRPPRDEYALTEKGLALRPALRALRDWGERHAPGG